MDFLKKASQSLGGEGGEADMMKEAQGFLSSNQNPSSGSATTDSTTKAAGEAIPSPTSPAATKEGYGAVFGNAQTLYQGLQDKMSGKPGVDDDQLAGAAEGVLKAAQDSGIDKDGQYSKYFQKAEGYLQDYNSKGGSTGAAGGAPAAAAPKSTGAGPADSAAPAPAGAPAQE